MTENKTLSSRKLKYWDKENIKGEDILSLEDVKKTIQRIKKRIEIVINKTDGSVGNSLCDLNFKIDRIIDEEVGRDLR